MQPPKLHAVTLTYSAEYHTEYSVVIFNPAIMQIEDVIAANAKFISARIPVDPHIRKPD